MRTLGLIAALAAAALVLAGCGDGKPVRAPCPAGKVCFEAGNGPDPVSIDPNLASGGVWESRLLTDMFMGLTTDGPGAETLPGAATSWETSADGLSWTFHLRPGAKWSDGAPVTSEDFAFSMRRVVDPKTASEYAPLINFIKNAQPILDGKMPPSALGVETPDPLTFIIRLEHPAPYLAELAKHQTLFPVPKHVVEKYGDQWANPKTYVSNGPYKLVSWKLGDRIHAVKNPYYWDADKLCVDEVNYYVIVDPATGERRIKSGEFDHLPDGATASNRLARMRQDIPAYVHTHTYLGVDYLAFNMRRAKFRDVRVRTALSMAIDRSFITQKLLRGGQGDAYTFVPEGVAGYQQVEPPYWAKWPLEKRQAEARRLLKEAGYGPGRPPLKVEIKHRNSPDPTLVMPAIQADWRAIGVDATLAAFEVQIAYQDYKNANFDVADAGWIADYNDAMSFLYLFDSHTGANNYSGYSNPKFDALKLASDNEKDPKKREAIMQEAERLVLAEAPVAIIWYTANKNLVTPRLTGFQDNIVDHHPTQFMCFKK
ncbi:MAG: peptide ABC transporter substrate-binding protein [Caulobacteraceae bacterium]|nr:MAG: peptide ABC transporter substrate-binding protein [Caulobacteraceae bacterium]